jgi:hypothetical protein
MSSQPFGARHPLSTLTGLDLGLRVRVQFRTAQRAIFSGAENLSLQALTSELAKMVSTLRVRSYALRGQLEEVTCALQANVECGSWPYARRAALDLSGLLSLCGRKRLADGERCRRGEQAALHVADLIQAEVR